MEQEKEDKSSEPRVALSAPAIKKMKAGDADKSDIGELSFECRFDPHQKLLNYLSRKASTNSRNNGEDSRRLG